jgi:nucleoside-diphosphate-sugar epimerase
VKRVLLTGASGFVGSHCLEPLVRRGYEVHAVHSAADPLPTPGVTWHRANLLDTDEVGRLLGTTRPTDLVHLAWNATPGAYADALDNVAWTESSLGLCRRFVEQGGRRIVTAGSSYEYDWRFGYCSESVTPLVPDTLYGRCKNALREVLESYSAAAGVSSAWARIFFLYGPREHPSRLVPSVIRSLLAGENASCSHGEQIRDYLHVADVGDALAALLDSGVEGPVNIASGRPVTLKSVVLRIASQLERPELLQLGALPARPNDVPLVVADVGRLRDEVSWQPSFQLDDGLAQTIDWWRDVVGAPA